VFNSEDKAVADSFDEYKLSLEVCVFAKVSDCLGLVGSVKVKDDGRLL